MWKCPYCGTINKDKVCLSCGREALQENGTTNKSNNVLITCVAMVCVAIIVVAICMTVLLVKYMGDGAGTTVENGTIPTESHNTIPQNQYQPIHTATPIPQKENGAYFNYHNDRFGFSLDVPDFLIYKQTSDNGDGATFYDESGEVELVAYGGYTTFLDHVTIDSLYKYIKNSVEYEISYDRKKDNWFVLSGESNGMVFYEKYVLKSDETHNCFRIVYPKYRQKEFDSIVTHIYNSFKTGVGYDSSSKK